MTKPENMLSEGVDEKSKLLEETDTPRQRCLKAMTIEWRMVLYKIQYFFLMGAESVDRVYLQLFMNQSGQSPTQIGIITGVAPYVVCLANIIGGMLANRYRSSKSILLFVSFATSVVAFATAILQMPRQISNCTLEISALNISSMDAQFDLGWLYEKSDVSKFFYVLLIAHTGFSIFRSLTMAFTDVGLISALGETGMHKYSRQKSFGSLGSTFLDLGTGAIVGVTIYKSTICDIELTFSDYQIAYYVVGTAMFICFLDSWTFPFGDEKRAKRVTTLPRSTDSTAIGSESNSSKLIQKDTEEEADDAISKRIVDYSKFTPRRLVGMFWSVHYGSWLLCVFYISFCLAVATYAYLYLELLGGDAYLIGVVSGVSSASDFIFYLLAFLIVQKLGTINSLYFTLMAYAIRFAILATIEDPWLGLLQAVISGCTVSVGWVAIIQHVTEGFPKTYKTAVIGIVHGLYFGLAVGTGQLIGGAVIDLIGGKYTFAIMAATTVPVTGLFCLSQKLSKRPSYKLLYDKEDKPQE